MAHYDTIIRGGMIVDGQRNSRFVGDVGITDGVIAKVGRITPDATCDKEIDASGLIVAPGFIDLHTHYDAQIFWDPYLTTSGWNGVTSVVIGNCGFGFAPVKKDLRERAMRSMTKVEAIPMATLESAMPWDWETYPEMLDSIDRAPLAVNVLPYVGVNPLLVWVMGLDDAKAGRKPTDAEHVEMARLLNEAMDAGACGWSAQCLGFAGEPEKTSGDNAAQSDFDGTPMPSDVMHQETRMVLAEVLGERGEGFIELSGGRFMTNEEWEDLARVSGAPMIYQAVVPSGGPMQDWRRGQMAWFEECHKRGLRIYGQGITQNPPLLFTFDYWDLWGPVWNELLGPDVPNDEKLRNFADPAVRERLRGEPMKVMFIDDIQDTRVHETKTERFKPYEGKPIGEIAKALDMHPVDLVCEIVLADNLETVFQATQFDTTLEGIKELIDSPYIIPGLSDGGAHLKYLAAGSYGTEYIAKYVREHKFSTLEEAHWRLSAFPAFCAGFQDRGTIREGSVADIIVYDYDKLDYNFPEFRRDLPGDEYRLVSGGSGYRYVIVNGQVTIENDEETGRHSGQLLRGGKADMSRMKAAGAGAQALEAAE
ncbi:MAG: amidohydrolase family protein [Novosphingobium sp.]|nr:amidohydrolase family protein [Novosphingobium sp.]